MLVCADALEKLIQEFEQKGELQGEARGIAKGAIKKAKETAKALSRKACSTEDCSDSWRRGRNSEELVRGRKITD